ncbi:MAG TPA: amidohydrolase family protein [Pseudonocardiaceae bacterium]|nr:amidohydrolase family protein [Pseudonocardiaceae bacterium]
MTIDGLSFVGASRFGYQRMADDVIQALDAEGIDTAVVAPMHPRDGDFGAANRELAAVVRAAGGRLVGLARVDPWDGAAALEHLTEAVGAGAKAVFLHPSEEHFPINHAVARPIAERAAELGIPVLVATGHHCMSEAAQVARFAQWCPDTPVIMTNGGQLNISGMGQFDAQLALDTSPRMHILSSGVYREDFLERMVEKFGAERLLFGSFAPLYDVRYEHQRVLKVHVTDEQRRLVLAGNAARLFGLE